MSFFKIQASALKSLAARAGWTAAQAAVGVLLVWLTDLGGASTDIPSQAWWAAGAATALSAVKSYIGAHVGDPSNVKFDFSSTGDAAV